MTLYVTLLGSVLAFAILARPLANWAEDRFVHKDDGYGRLLTEYYADASRRGLSYREASAELEAREAMVRIRRLASDAVCRDPSNWLAIIESTKAETIGELMRHRPHIAMAVQRGFDGLTYAHVLYPDAAGLVDRLPRETCHFRPSTDQMAALRIVG